VRGEVDHGGIGQLAQRQQHLVHAERRGGEGQVGHDRLGFTGAVTELEDRCCRRVQRSEGPSVTIEDQLFATDLAQQE
jgi:hypothetical protein